MDRFKLWIGANLVGMMRKKTSVCTYLERFLHRLYSSILSMFWFQQVLKNLTVQLTYVLAFQSLLINTMRIISLREHSTQPARQVICCLPCGCEYLPRSTSMCAPGISGCLVLLVAASLVEQCCLPLPCRRGSNGLFFSLKPASQIHRGVQRRPRYR